MIDKEHLYSEIFYSIQGEGKYTGVPTAWLRYFSCNLQCNGFGQDFPTNPSTHELPYKDINPADYDTMEELPVFDKGCDSSYSWASKFKCLQHSDTADVIVDKIAEAVSTESNPEGLFHHPKTLQPIHMCFTGGEPMLKNAQLASVEILKRMRGTCNIPSSITFETNGTQPLTEEFTNLFENKGMFSGELFFSVSPKLYNVSGEKPEKAIKPDVVRQYQYLSGVKNGQLKFVVRDKPEVWDELEKVIEQFRYAGVQYPVWIMPVGATVEEQESSAGDVAEKAFKKGYNVSSRVHCYLWGNKIGV